jgi:hypothetical protein
MCLRMAYLGPRAVLERRGTNCSKRIVRLSDIPLQRRVDAIALRSQVAIKICSLMRTRSMLVG